jgi:hypothetical protein
MRDPLSTWPYLSFEQRDNRERAPVFFFFMPAEQRRRGPAVLR